MKIIGLGTLFTIIIIALLLFIVILRRQIRLKTSALSAANELLKHSEEHFRLSFENAYIGVCTISAEGRLLSVNQRMCEIFGYDKQELEGVSVNEITHPDYKNVSPTFMKKASSGEISHAEFEKQYIHKHGDIIWGKVSSSIIRDSQGKPLYFISHVQDITEQKLTEDVQSFLLRYDYIASSENFFQALARYLAEKLEADFVCIDILEDNNLAARTLSVWYNGKFEDNMTYTLKDTPCGDVVGKTICSYAEGVRHLFPKDEILQQMSAEGYVGTTLWSSEGQAIGLIALIWRNPLTNQQIVETILKLAAVRAAGELERKQAEDALNNAYTLFREVINSSPDLIFVKDINFKYLICNRAFTELIGHPENHIVGHEDTEWFPDHETVEYFRVWDRKIFSEKIPYAIEEWVTYPDKRRVLLETVKSPCFDQTGKLIGLVGISRDITERKKTEEQLTRFSRVFEDSLNEIYIFDADTLHFIQANRAALSNIGYSMDELRYLTPLNIKPDYTAEIFSDIIEPLRSGAENKIVFYAEHQRKDGSLYPVEVHLQLITYGSRKSFVAIILDITERRQAEEQFRTIFDMALDMICIADINKATFIKINPAFSNTLGYSEKELTERPFLDFVHSDDVDKTISVIETELKKGVNIISFENRYRCKDGSYRHLIWNSHPIPERGITFAVAHDITDRKKAEAALWESIREYRSLFENMISGFAYHQMIFDENSKPTDYIFLEINSAFEKHTGLTREVIGKRVSEVLPGIEKHDPDFIAIYGEVALTGKSVRFDVYAEPQQRFYTVSAYSPQKGFFAAVFDDITERKRAEDELNRFFNLVPDMVCIASADGYFIKLNKEWERVLGYSEEELLTVPLADFIHPDDREATFREVERQIAGNATLNFINRYRAKDGSYRWFDWNATPSVEGKFLFAAARDITERRRTEEAIYTRLHLREYADSHTLDELLQYTLDKAEQLTGSQIGFFHFLSADQKILKLQMWSTNTLKNMCTAEGKGAHYPVEQAGIWADCVREQQPVIHNDYASLPARKGMPEGHAPIIRELTLPVIRGSRIMAIIGIGNKPSDYTEADVRTVSELADMSWDIISNKLAEEALRKSEERYRKAQTLGKVGNWEYNIRTTYFWGSDEAKRIYGFDPDAENFTTEEVEKCIPERDRVHQALVDLIEKNAEYNLEFDIVTYNTGEQKTIISIAQLERDSNGHPLKITGVIHDITDRKRMENILKESEEKFYKAFHSSPALMSITTLEEGVFLDVNTQFLKITELTREEVIDQKSSDIGLWQTEQRQKILSVLKDEGFAHNLEVELTTKSGKSIPLLWFGDIIQIQNKPCLVVTGYDLTERKQAEAEKAKLESRLRQAQSMEAIGTLAGGIAHDFNNILFPIIGYTEMTTDDLPEGSRGWQNLREVLKAALRAKELVNQILTFSRQQENEKVILKIQPIVKEALKLIRATLPSTIELFQNIDPDCDPVMGDPTQIHQIIMNLCTNAYHAMQDNGGKLEVSLNQTEVKPEDAASYPGVSPGYYLKLSVSDTGVGIPKETLARIFDPFFTTKPVGRGTGLGLSVVHGIVTQMSGHIRVYSEPGNGTAVIIYLPTITSESSIIRTSADPAEPPPTGTEHILLVDDEEPILVMLGKMLEELGYRITPRTSSVEAFKAFQNKPDSFDLVITDMTMPNMTGVRLAGKILEIRPDMPIILCTGFSELINGEKTAAMGIRGYLMKPVIRADMAKTIRKVLEGL